MCCYIYDLKCENFKYSDFMFEEQINVTEQCRFM